MSAALALEQPSQPEDGAEVSAGYWSSGPRGQGARVWDRKVPTATGGRRPAIWLLGAHGGAGVSTLAAQWAPAGDALGGWPAMDTPNFVVIVARMHMTGLEAAHRLCVQHRSGQAGGCSLLGVVTVAAGPGKPASTLANRRELVADAAGAHWHIDWRPELLTLPPSRLAQWMPSDPEIDKTTFRKSAGVTEMVPPQIAQVGADIFDTARATRSQQ